MVGSRRTGRSDTRLRLGECAEGVTARRPRFGLRASVAPCEKPAARKRRFLTDGQGRTLVSFRYDRKTGRPVRVTDRLGNLLDYDADGNCTRLSRRAGGIFSSAEPVRSFAYDRRGRLASVSELDGKWDVSHGATEARS